MELINRVIWSEGMFLKPHHFQQQERYYDYQLANTQLTLHHHFYGISKLTIDQQLLKQGKFAVIECEGIFPDHTYFNIPYDTPTPNPIDIPKEISNTTIYLAVPLKRYGTSDTKLSGMHDNNFAYRYTAKLIETNDFSTKFDNSAQIEIAKLQTHILNQDHCEGYSCIGIATINEVNSSGLIILEDKYIPTCTNIFASNQLTVLCREISAMLFHRAELITQSILHEQGHIETSELIDFLLLQIINRYQLRLNHFQHTLKCHPEQFYLLLAELVSELATLTTKDRRTPTLQPYQHDNLQLTFDLLISQLRSCLSTVFEQKALQLPLKLNNQGVWISPINDRSLLHSANFFLTANANIALKELQELLPKMIKIGPTEQIQNMINHALPGIPIEQLPVAPRHLPYMTSTCYFQLDQSSETWNTLEHSAALALQISGNIEELKIELWAIKP